jgi:NADH-quinone oxidoreductase subunit F
VTTSPAGCAAPAICAQLERRFGAAGATGEGGAGPGIRSPCLGQCERGPRLSSRSPGKSARVVTLAPADADAIGRAIGGRIPGPAPGQGAGAASRPGPEAPQTLDPVAAGPCGSWRRRARRPGSLDDYRAHGGYAALRHAPCSDRKEVIREVSGRG